MHQKQLEIGRVYYFKNVKPKEHIIGLGKKLYVKITEVIASEVEAITEEDCIAYVLDLVIKRTFDGYMTEKERLFMDNCKKF